jgi:hypothetical protein
MADIFAPFKMISNGEDSDEVGVWIGVLFENGYEFIE